MPSAGGSSSPADSTGQIVNLYGRSIGAAFPHRLLPRSKGGLFAWESVSRFSTVILVEGLFDLAVLWQAGFRNTTCALGTQLTPAQLAAACRAAGPFRVHLPSTRMKTRLARTPLISLPNACKVPASTARIVQLPAGHDPNSYFVAGASAADFTACLREAAPAMKFSVVYRPSVPASASPYRLLDEHGRRRSPGPMPSSMLSTFANFPCVPCALMLMTCCTSPVGGSERPASVGDHRIHPARLCPSPTGSTTQTHAANHKSSPGRDSLLYRFHYGQEIPAGQSHFQRFYTTRLPLGDGRPHRAVDPWAPPETTATRDLYPCVPKKSRGSGAAFAPFAISPWWA